MRFSDLASIDRGTLAEVLQQHGIQSSELGRSNGVPRRPERIPLSFAQQRLWFIDQLEEDAAAYNSPMAARLRGKLRLEALEAGLNEIVRRHEVLRTRLVMGDG